MNKYTKLNVTKEQMRYLKKKLKITKMEDIETTVLKDLKETFKELKDPRQKSKTRYKIWDIVCYVIFAQMSGAEDWEDIEEFIYCHYDFFRKFLLMTGGVPNYQTIERVMTIIDSQELESMLVEFIKKITLNQKTETEILNIDGRIDCGSSRKETNYHGKTSPLNVLNVYSNNYGMCLASEMIEDKTNEITTIPLILERLNIKDTVITWDALNTQKRNVEIVKSKRGNYVVPVKKNHPNFNTDLEIYFDEQTQEEIIAGRSDSAYLKEIEKSHSCYITYEYFQTTDVKWYSEHKEWKGLNSFGMVKKTIEKNKETIIEKRFYISSLFIDIGLFSKSIRNHWSVENKLHWHLDFTFREDKNTTQNKKALMNLQLINKFCLGIFSRIKPFYKNKSLRRMKKIMGMDFEEILIKNICYLLLS